MEDPPYEKNASGLSDVTSLNSNCDIEQDDETNLLLHHSITIKDEIESDDEEDEGNSYDSSSISVRYSGQSTEDFSSDPKATEEGLCRSNWSHVKLKKHSTVPLDREESSAKRRRVEKSHLPSANVSTFSIANTTTKKCLGDPTDSFFKSIEGMVRGLPLKLQIQAKRNIFKAVLNCEVLALERSKKNKGRH